MLRRPETARFAPGVFVFAGGAVGSGDLAEAGDDARLATLLAGVREVFEEVGILLARDAKGRWPAPEQVTRLLGKRERLHTGNIRLLDLLSGHDLRPALEALSPFSHWITPESRPRRFDTRFFLAPLPEGQVVAPDPLETRGVAWWHPGEALEAHAREQLPLMGVTRRHLLRLSRFASLEEAFAYGLDREIRPVLTVMREREGQPVEVLLPDQVEPEWRD